LPLGAPLGVFHNIFLSKQPSECFRTSYWNFHPVDSLRKKHRLVVYVRTKVYLCGHKYLYTTKIQKLCETTKPPLEKVEAYLYVLQHVTQEIKRHKKGVPEF
jgi:hypothetical protein